MVLATVPGRGGLQVPFVRRGEGGRAGRLLRAVAHEVVPQEDTSVPQLQAHARRETGAEGPKAVVGEEGREAAAGCSVLRPEGTALCVESPSQAARSAAESQSWRESESRGRGRAVSLQLDVSCTRDRKLEKRGFTSIRNHKGGSCVACRPGCL